jgi:hypothetical protein
MVVPGVSEMQQKEPPEAHVSPGYSKIVSKTIFSQIKSFTRPKGDFQSNPNR